MKKILICFLAACSFTFAQEKTKLTKPEDSNKTLIISNKNIISFAPVFNFTLGKYKDMMPYGYGAEATYKRIFSDRWQLGFGGNYANMTKYPNVINISTIYSVVSFRIFTANNVTTYIQMDTGLAAVQKINTSTNEVAASNYHSLNLIASLSFEPNLILNFKVYSSFINPEYINIGIGAGIGFLL